MLFERESRLRLSGKCYGVFLALLVGTLFGITMTDYLTRGWVEGTVK